MPSDKKTCGPLYQEQLKQFVGNDRELRLFTAGFITGQAEKIYLGACGAAMFRPSPEHKGLVTELVEIASVTYGLCSNNIGEEIWLFHPDVAPAFIRLKSIIPNTITAHFMRATLCGVPLREIDYKFHERNGYGKDCDKIGSNGA